MPKFIQIHGNAGAGKKTLIGRLIYEYGGLGLPQLEKIERNGIREYTQLAAFYESQHLTRLFYTPSSQFTIDESKRPDALIWIVDATVSDSGRTSSQNLASLISTTYTQPPGCLLILVNKMDLVNWSSNAFEEIAHTFSTADPIAKR
ncbi:hypothetical protein GGS26DRAFT_601143 [Hypomontagnella submonticulosa]|nr:hypothetical protein GGS26DRAFT_601143 [Hypomontagnella submonticulosa]